MKNGLNYFGLMLDQISSERKFIRLDIITKHSLEESQSLSALELTHLCFEQVTVIIFLEIRYWRMLRRIILMHMPCGFMMTKVQKQSSTGKCMTCDEVNDFVYLAECKHDGENQQFRYDEGYRQLWWIHPKSKQQMKINHVDEAEGKAILQRQAVIRAID